MGAGQITRTPDWALDWAAGFTAVLVVAVVKVVTGTGCAIPVPGGFANVEGEGFGREISGTETLFQLGAPRRDQPITP